MEFVIGMQVRILEYNEDGVYFSDQKPHIPHMKQFINCIGTINSIGRYHILVTVDNESWHYHPSFLSLDLGLPKQPKPEIKYTISKKLVNII